MKETKNLTQDKVINSWYIFYLTVDFLWASSLILHLMLFIIFLAPYFIELLFFFYQDFHFFMNKHVLFIFLSLISFILYIKTQQKLIQNFGEWPNNVVHKKFCIQKNIQGDSRYTSSLISHNNSYVQLR